MIWNPRRKDLWILSSDLPSATTGLTRFFSWIRERRHVIKTSRESKEGSKEHGPNSKELKKCGFSQVAPIGTLILGFIPVLPQLSCPLDFLFPGKFVLRTTWGSKTQSSRKCGVLVNTLPSKPDPYPSEPSPLVAPSLVL